MITNLQTPAQEISSKSSKSSFSCISESENFTDKKPFKRAQKTKLHKKDKYAEIFSKFTGN